MYSSNPPSESELPSTERLLQSTVTAALAALVLLLTIVMPAEYGIDPTGIGGITGLKRMGEIKMALAAEAAAEEQALAAALNSMTETAAEVPVAQPITIVESPAVSSPLITTPESTAETLQPVDAQPAPESVTQADTLPVIRSDEMQVSLAPGEGTEIKVTLAQGKTVEYSWQSTGGIANFDVHGDSVPLEIEYHSYSRGAQESSSGVLEAAFDGNHGWFWRNRTSNPITVTLETRGEYTDIKHLE